MKFLHSSQIQAALTFTSTVSLTLNPSVPHNGHKVFRLSLKGVTSCIFAAPLTHSMSLQGMSCQEWLCPHRKRHTVRDKKSRACEM